MANTISFSVSLNMVGTGVSIAGSVSGSFSQAGTGGIADIQSIATSATQLTFSSATPTGGGAVLVYNTDPTNYVEVDSVNTFTNFPQKLLPGKGLILWPETNTIYAKANTSACLCYVVAVTP